MRHLPGLGNRSLGGHRGHGAWVLAVGGCFRWGVGCAGLCVRGLGLRRLRPPALDVRKVPLQSGRSLSQESCTDGCAVRGRGPKASTTSVPSVPTWSHAFWPRGREKRTSCSEEAGESPGGSGRLKTLQCPQVTWGNASVITKALRREAGGGGQVSEIKRQMTGRGARW